MRKISWIMLPEWKFGNISEKEDAIIGKINELVDNQNKIMEKIEKLEDEKARN